MKSTLYIGSDHAGFELKQHLITALSASYDIIDCGPATYIKGDDYPAFAKKVCEQVLRHNERGILICDTGIGMSIAANRFSNIRAAMVTSHFMAERSRLHNNANIICLGSQLHDPTTNEDLVRTWLTTDFTQDERHLRRLRAIETLTDAQSPSE